MTAAVEAHRGFVASETLATSVALGPAGAEAFEGEVGDGETLRVAVKRAR